MVKENNFGKTEVEAYAYTPGLKIKTGLYVRKIRKLPILGEVLVENGENVDFDTVVARTKIPSEKQIIKVARILNIEPVDLPSFITKKVGDKVKKGDVVAEYISFFGLVKKFVRAPCDGVIDTISEVVGQILVRPPPISFDLKAYIPGKIINVLPGEGVELETYAAYIQGIFGIGGERHGKIKMAAKSPESILTDDMITHQDKGKILIVGTLATREALNKAVQMGVIGIISGGVESSDLADFLGYRIGVAITGEEQLGITLIITEGLGKMRMTDRCFNLFNQFEGYEAAINGTTQIRAGVIRPEIIIPHPQIGSEDKEEELLHGVKLGMTIRIIREPYFGRIGTIVSLPVSLQKINTESFVRVVEVKLRNGEKVIIPRANMEVIEE